MPINILLADDSVPAQNMGKKILVDAGYEVLTVSNGLEALRKIAETIPDIAILDIFMPGYTGLEICERLRASAATATLPVILTVGKLEPYRPQDGEHVHSNAVIVKPFAAAELVSAVRSLIGPPPVKHAEAKREFAGRSNVADVDPLQENPFAETGPGEVPDEPLFSYDPSTVQENGSPLDGRPIVYGVEPFPSSNAEAGGPESLVFNPDAEHTPFSASAIDLLPAASHMQAEQGASTFTEFNLEPEKSHDSSAEQQKISPVEESPLAALTAVADARSVASPSAVLVADSLAAPVEVVSVPGEAAELKLPALNISALDSFLEVREAATRTGGSRAILADWETPRETHEEVDAGRAESPFPLPTSLPAQEDEEEARRLAFEALFNSSEPFPVENSPLESKGNVIDTLPSMADLSRDHPFDVVPDSGIESLIDDRQSEFISPDPDPYLLQEEEAMSTVGEIPDRDALLEDGLQTNWPVAPSAPPLAESIVTVTEESYSAEAEEPSEVRAESLLDAVTVEPENIAIDAHPAEPEIFAPQYPAEIEQTAAGALTEQPQFVSEVVPSAEQQTTPEQAVQSEASVEHFETEVEDVPQQVQPAFAEAQPPTQLQQSSSEVLSPPSEAERIHEAVERVFDRFKPLLVSAIVRELARRD